MSLQSDQNLRGPHVARQQHRSVLFAARARPQQQTRRPPLLLSIDGTDRRTDTRPFDDAYRILCGPRKKTQNPIRTNATNGGRRVVKAAAATCHLVCSRATHLCQEGRTSMELDASGWLVAPSDICLQYLAVRPRSPRSLHSGCAI